MPNRRTAINKWSRALHRWGTLLVALPLLLVIATGVLLMLKGQSAWVQPPTARAPSPGLTIGWEGLLEAASSVDGAGVEGWGDIDRVDVRPGRGVAKIRARSRWEIQVDTSSGAVLASAYRRSDLIESLHDGSFFGDPIKLWVFLPSGVVLLVLWLTGIWLWFMPHLSKRARARGASRSDSLPRV